MRRFAPLSFLFALAGVFACSDERDLLDPGPTVADLRLGKQAFEESCSGCHASRDGFDLKMFGFADTTIVRRAVHHVDSLTARNIAAYIRSVEAPPNVRSARLFQPGGFPVGSDVEFAVALLGSDAWPADMSSAELKAIDPRTVKVAIELPVWSDEGTNLDWMPDFAPSAGVFDFKDATARKALAKYREEPTTENVIKAVETLRNADRASSNAAAPCRPDSTGIVRYRECFEVRRWASTLLALHILRNGTADQDLGRIHDVWWDAGNAARRSLADPTVPIANAERNWATWMYLGWTFDPSLHPSLYIGRAFEKFGYFRHATFLALRSQVERPKNSVDMYEDVTTAARYAPPSWTMAVVTQALRHIAERHAAGERPPTANTREAGAKALTITILQIKSKVSAEDRIQIESMIAPLVADLQ